MLVKKNTFSQQNSFHNGSLHPASSSYPLNLTRFTSKLCTCSSVTPNTALSVSYSLTFTSPISTRVMVKQSWPISIGSTILRISTDLPFRSNGYSDMDKNSATLSLDISDGLIR